MQAVLNALNVKKALVVLKDNDQNVLLSARNIADVRTVLTSTTERIRHSEVRYSSSYQGCCREHRGGVCIMADIKYYDVILKPVVTEKSMNAMADKKYTFLVHHGRNQEPDQRGC